MARVPLGIPNPDRVKPRKSFPDALSRGMPPARPGLSLTLRERSLTRFCGEENRGVIPIPGWGGGASSFVGSLLPKASHGAPIPEALPR